MSRYLADVDLENDVVTLHDKNEELKSEFVKIIVNTEVGKNE